MQNLNLRCKGAAGMVNLGNLNLYNKPYLFEFLNLFTFTANENIGWSLLVCLSSKFFSYDSESIARRDIILSTEAMQTTYKVYY